MPTYNFSSTNFSISFTTRYGNEIYYNTTKLSEEDVTTSSTDSQEHIKEINQTIPFEEAMGF